MVNRPKIITILASLWLALGVIFIIPLCPVSYLLIIVIFTGNPSYDPGLYRACLIWVLIMIIFLLTFSILSLRQWHSIFKLKKSAIERSLILSSIVLIFWGCITMAVFVLQNSTIEYNLLIFITIILCSILIVDISIIILSISPLVKKFLKA
jgi:hypothetical protein